MDGSKDTLHTLLVVQMVPRQMDLPCTQSMAVHSTSTSQHLLNNEYTYTFRLVNLPDGATDSTANICDGNSAFGCASFKIKVDASKPEIDDDSWTAS